MRHSLRAILLVLFFSTLGMAQSKKMEVTNLPDHPFQVDYPSGSQLSIHVRSGDVRVVGSNNNKLTVRVSAKDWEKAKEIKVRFERLENSGELDISGGPKDDTQITIEVPRATGLFIRMPAGQMEISEVTGDKDVELHAGELIVGVGNPADYSHVDASVITGGIEAPPFSEDHGGLFRSFQKNGHGKYKLHAHVGAGDVTLK